MKKIISALLIPVMCWCLVACGNSQNEPGDTTAMQGSSGQEYVGVWQKDAFMFNLDGESWYETKIIVLNEDGTAIYREKHTTWEYDEKYGKYGTIEIALDNGGTASLIIAEENGKRVLRHDVGFYYRENDFPEATD